jgi:hypothetical protein
MTICQEKKIPTKAFERSNVDLFACLRDMGFGPIFADMPGPRSLWGFRPTGRRLGDTLRLNHTGRPLVDAILNSSLSYMRLVFFDSAVKGQNLLKSSIRIMEI